jgi:hypothetical protein
MGRDAKLQPTDYDEHMCRAIACEILAMRIIHTLPSDKLQSVMSCVFLARFGLLLRARS